MRNFIITLVLFTMLSVCTGKDNGKRQENVGNNRNDMILNIDNFKWTRQPEFRYQRRHHRSDNETEYRPVATDILSFP